jgi:hypothetical protein
MHTSKKSKMKVFWANFTGIEGVCGVIHLTPCCLTQVNRNIIPSDIS